MGRSGFFGVVLAGDGKEEVVPGRGNVQGTEVDENREVPRSWKVSVVRMS